MKSTELPEPRGVVWDDDLRNDLRHAADLLVHEVIELICADPMHQTEQERRRIVAYLNSMAAAIREAR